MSDDPEDATSDDTSEQTDEEATSDDEQPEIEDDEMADFSAVADEIEDAAGADVDDDEDGDSDDQEDSADEPDMSMDATAGDRVTPGDIYCNALGMGAAVARASYGSADADDRSDLVDEYGDMARDLEIDTYVDQWLEEQGGIDELTPGQAILLSTVMFGGMVAMDDPEMLENVAQRGGEA